MSENMMIYLVIGFVFVLILKAIQEALEYLEYDADEIDSMSLSPYQIVVIFLTWPFWLLLLISFLFYPYDSETDD